MEIMNRILDMMAGAGPYAFWAGVVYMLLHFLVMPCAFLLGITLIFRGIREIMGRCGFWPAVYQIAGLTWTAYETNGEKLEAARRAAKRLEAMVEER